MATVESRLEELGLVLPEPMILPPGAIISFPWVRIHGNRAFISGHGPLKDDGSLWTPLGKVGAEVSPEEAYVAARQVGLAILSSLKRELGDLDRVTCWLKILGMVNSAPGFLEQPTVINGYSELMAQVFGEDAGVGARSAVGMGPLPGNIPVEIECIFEVN